MDNAAPFSLVTQDIWLPLTDDFIYFGPKYFPDRIQVKRERNLNRKQNFCKGEDVTDNGAKNRDIHIKGRLVGDELEEFDELLEHDDELEMTSATWSGEVRLAQGEYEGPTGMDGESGDLIWEYRLDLVSTGAEYRDSSSGNGIISRPP